MNGLSSGRSNSRTVSVPLVNRASEATRGGSHCSPRRSSRQSGGRYLIAPVRSQLVGGPHPVGISGASVQPAIREGGGIGWYHANAGPTSAARLAPDCKCSFVVALVFPGEGHLGRGNGLNSQVGGRDRSTG